MEKTILYEQKIDENNEIWKYLVDLYLSEAQRFSFTKAKKVLPEDVQIICKHKYTSL